MPRSEIFRPAVRALLALAVGTLPSCTLLLDDVPEVEGQRCHFSGETATNCGYCVAAQCQEAVNGCCDASCKAIDDLDDCAGSGLLDACEDLRSPTKTSGRDGKLRTCVASKCDSECASPTVVPPIICFENTLPGEPQGCRCSTEDIPLESLDVCSEASPAGARCCADIGWPGAGLECICRSMGCRETSSGCECSISEAGPLASCAIGAYCCADSIGCRCGPDPCDSSYVTVPMCSIDALPCSTDRVLVSACKG